MRKQHRYRPAGCHRLEDRLALTHGGPITPALIGTLSPKPAAAGPKARIQAQITAAYQSFSQDYFQAQSAYLSSGGSATTDIFKAFTTQRVNLLAQDLVRSMERLPGTLDRLRSQTQRSQTNSTYVLQAFINTKITGPVAGSLLTTLTNANVVPPPNATSASATIYTLTATDAIQSSLVTTINAIKFISLGTYNKH